MTSFPFTAQLAETRRADLRAFATACCRPLRARRLVPFLRTAVVRVRCSTC